MPGRVVLSQGYFRCDEISGAIEQNKHSCYCSIYFSLFYFNRTQSFSHCLSHLLPPEKHHFEERIIYKLCLFMHYIHIGLAPKYLSDCVYTVSAASGRYRLRSTGSEAYILPRTRTRFGERGFFYSAPAAWNTLPSDLHDITDTSTFRKRLKNVLFDRAFN